MPGTLRATIEPAVFIAAPASFRPFSPDWPDVFGALEGEPLERAGLPPPPVIVELASL
jgi:hypothetical protein